MCACACESDVRVSLECLRVTGSRLHARSVHSVDLTYHQYVLA